MKVTYYVATTVDGFIARTDGSIDWLNAFDSPGGESEDYGYGTFIADVDALIMGRRTFEHCLTLGPWPYDGQRVLVASHGGVEAQHGVTVTAATPQDIVRDLAADGVRHLWMVGGGALAGAWQAAGLIDEYVMTVMPIVLGCGIPLLRAAGREQSLELLDQQRWPNGILQLRYRARPSV